MTNSPVSAVAAPLQNFAVVNTHNVDEACAEVARIFCPHQLLPHEKLASGFHARHHSRAINDVSMNFVAYGATVDIDPGMLSGFYLLQIPLAGTAQVKCGTVVAEASAGQVASILSPTLPTRMTWQAGCEKIIVQIKKQALHHMYESLFGRHAPEIEFNTKVDLQSPTGGILSRHVAMMVAAAEQLGPAHSRYLDTLRDGLMVELLSSLDHSRRRYIETDYGTMPASVQKADDFIMANYDRNLSVTEIANAVGVSLRSLQMAYVKSREMTLWQRLQLARLERFRTKLLEAQRDESVTEMALDAGFGHLGRAARLYFEKYGERPVETLRHNSKRPH